MSDNHVVVDANTPRGLDIDTVKRYGSIVIAVAKLFAKFTSTDIDDKLVVKAEELLNNEQFIKVVVYILSLFPTQGEVSEKDVVFALANLE